MGTARFHEKKDKEVRSSISKETVKRIVARKDKDIQEWKLLAQLEANCINELRAENKKLAKHCMIFCILGTLVGLIGGLYI